MGLAASQARYLTLTARKSDLEYQSQTINSRRIQLSYKTAEIARAYSEGMNNKVIKINLPNLNTDGTVTKNWQELTFDNLLEQGYMIIGTAGTKLFPAPYKKKQLTVNYYNIKESGKSLTLTAKEYDELTPADLQDAFVTGEPDKDGNAQYVLLQEIPASVYEKLNATYKDYFNSTPVEKRETTWEVNPDYLSSPNPVDLQTLLVSGKAQIVPIAFFNFLKDNGAYTYSTGLQSSTYQELLDRWTSNKGGCNPDHLQSVIDWRSDETSTFAQKTYTEDDADVLAAYESATAEVQAQDKMLEMEEKNIETQHKAIETELENIKKVIQKNIEETFKIFS